MNLKVAIERRRVTRAGLTLLDVVVAVGLMAVMVASLYVGITQGFGVIQLARENLRATQILQEKTETIRLYTWDQITTAGFIPREFAAPFYATGAQEPGGLLYRGLVTIENAPIAESYAPDLKQVVVQVEWTSGDVPRRRTMRTLVSRHGLHNYIY